MTCLPDTLLFDFDYTLVDSSPGVIACANHALGELGLPAQPSDDIRRMIGLTLTDSFVTLAGEAERSRSRAFVQAFTQHADRMMNDLTTLLPGAREAVVCLCDAGYRLGIISTKYAYRIRALLERERLLNAFAVIIGGEDVALPKPDPSGVNLALERLRTDPTRAWYVGDSAVDGETAAHSGLSFVAVLTGVTPRERLESHKPRAVLHSVAELPALLEIRSTKRQEER